MSHPTEITLTLDLDRHLANHLGYDENDGVVNEPTTVEALVLGLAANRLVAHVLADARYGTPDADASALREIKASIREQARDAAAARVGELVETALDEVTHEVTDDGARVITMTLRETIRKSVEAAVKLRPSDPRNGRAGWMNGEKSVTERYIDDVTSREIREGLAEVVADVKERVRTEVAEAAAASVAKAVVR